MATYIIHLLNESCSRYVSFELRNGTCDCLLRNACMTSPSDDKLRLMFCASLSRSPEAPLFDTRSDPAKSIRFSLPGKKNQTSAKVNE